MSLAALAWPSEAFDSRRGLEPWQLFFRSGFALANEHGVGAVAAAGVAGGTLALAGG